MKNVTLKATYKISAKQKAKNKMMNKIIKITFIAIPLIAITLYIFCNVIFHYNEFIN